MGRDITLYENNLPEFVFEAVFGSTLKTTGIVKNRGGDVTRSFAGELSGSREGEQFILDEWFEYDDGERAERAWILKQNGEKSYIGTCQDVKGEITIELAGNAMLARYTLIVPYKGSTISIDLEDWSYLQEDGIVLNHVYMKKFGFSVGEVFAITRGKK